jgi:hypothetical protein
VTRVSPLNQTPPTPALSQSPVTLTSRAPAAFRSVSSDGEEEVDAPEGDGDGGSAVGLEAAEPGAVDPVHDVKIERTAKVRATTTLCAETAGVRIILRSPRSTPPTEVSSSSRHRIS